MRKTLLAIVAAAVLAASSAWASPLTEEEENEAIAQETEHNLNKFIMAGCEELSDVTGTEFDRTARQRHMALTLDDCIKASAALAEEAEKRKPK